MINTDFLTSSDGTVWLDGDKLSNVKSLDCTVSLDYDDIKPVGTRKTYYAPKGYTISGTLTLVKINSRILEKYKSAVKSGIIPELTIVSQIKSKNTGEIEMISISGVVPESLVLININGQDSIEEKIPFKASEYEVLENIQ